MKKRDKFILCPKKSYYILNPAWIKRNYPDTYNMILEESKNIVLDS